MSLVLTAIHLYAKFEVSSFIRPGDIRGSQNYKRGHMDPHMTPFNLILHFFRQYSLPSISVPNLKFLALFVQEILGGHKIPKVGHVTPTWPFWLNFAFFSSLLTAIHLDGKCEVSSFIRPGDIMGGHKIPKVGHVTTT